jgi:hypothetical protein
VVRLPRLRISLQALLLSAALLCVFGPHLLMLGYRAAGAQPPSALSFFCVLHHGGGTSKPAAALTWSIHPGSGSR